MSKWRPIETAPKDGTRMLLWDGEMIWVGAWFGYRREFAIACTLTGPRPLDEIINDRGEDLAIKPTHWAMLPGVPA